MNSDTKTSRECRWDAAQYTRFGDERSRPAIELLARVPLASVAKAVDLGCGTGSSTALLAARWPEADIVGVDNSPEMLAQARSDWPALVWQEADLVSWTPVAPPDLVFSNAALQWVPQHGVVLPRLLGHLRDGGFLAVQMPANFDAPSHQCMRLVGQDPRWRARLAHISPTRPIASAKEYYDLLLRHGRSVDIWETEYYHQMDSVDEVVEWLKGTGLRPFLAPLEDAERAEFLGLYREALAQGYPEQSDGRILFPFRRTFFIAKR